jgi:hypothetical protein
MRPRPKVVILVSRIYTLFLTTGVDYGKRGGGEVVFVQGVGEGSLIESGGGGRGINALGMEWHKHPRDVCLACVPFILGARESICPVTRTRPARQPVCRTPRMVHEMNVSLVFLLFWGLENQFVL